MLLLALLTLGVFVAPSIASAQQLSLTWVDNSGGQAGFIIQRATGASGAYTQIAQVPVGVVSYTDTTVSSGTTYCYQVAAINSAGVSDFSNVACGSPAAGLSVTVTTTGTGSGSVVSSPAGITCPGTCVQSYAAGTVLTLTATPATGSSFTGWSGSSCAGTAACVLTGNTPVSVTAAFALNGTAPTPSITSLSPSSVMAGSAAFALTVTGSGFVSGASATVGGQARTVTFGSATQVTIAVQAADVASQGNVPVQVSNPSPCAGGLCASNSVALTVTAPTPAPTLSSVSPTSAIAGSAAFTLTATGSNFTANSVVRVNGSPRTTTFVSPTQVTAAILASDIATPGTPSITVFTPAPGGGTSGGQTLTVLGPSLTVNTTSVVPGGAATATLTNSPGGSTDWLTLAQVGTADTSYLQWVYVGAGATSRTWTVAMPTTPGQYEFRFYPNNGFVRAATSPAVTVVTINSTPSITSLSPSSVVASSAAFALTVTGSGFVTGATATVGGQPRTVTFGSATQLTIAVSAADVASPGSVAVQVGNPTPCAGGLCASSSLALTVTAPPPAPTLSSISPSTASAGGPTFSLTATGTNFTANSSVQVNGSPRVTTVVSATQLTATILASDIVAAGSLSITVATPTPGGGTSGSQTLTVSGPAIAVSATSAAPGDVITATLSNSPGNASDWLALAAVGSPNTSYLQWAYVGAGVTNRPWVMNMPTTAGAYEYRLYLNNSYTVAAKSVAVSIVNTNPTPAITSLNPAGVAAGSGAAALTVDGTGFVSGATATVGGQARTVTFVSSTQLTIALVGTDVAAVGTIPVQVTNSAPCVSGVCASNTVNLNVTGPPPPPTLTSISPATVGRGGAAFTLTAIGSGFAGNSVVQVNGVARVTAFVSATQLTATILAGDIATAAALNITVVTPAPGGGTSSSQTLTITGPGITVSATSSLPGGAITATLSNSPGGGADWLALAQVGAPDTSYLQYVYVGAGVTNRLWAVTMPATPGTYEFRLYLNNSYTVATRSPAVSVTSSP